jgi:hypothetical protein
LSQKGFYVRFGEFSDPVRRPVQRLLLFRYLTNERALVSAWPKEDAAIAKLRGRAGATTIGA